MIIRITHRLKRFRKQEDGSAILMEFMILTPVLFGAFFMAMEMGMYSIRQMQLDRGLEVTTREVRLNTARDFTHDELKDTICINAGGLPNCSELLRLEMMPVDPRNYAGLPATLDCVDTSREVNPVRGFTLGEQHELMIMRVCYKFDPIFPTTGLGQAFVKDGSGQVAMTSTSAFVQEPS